MEKSVDKCVDNMRIVNRRDVTGGAHVDMNRVVKGF